MKRIAALPDAVIDGRVVGRTLDDLGFNMMAQ
jgi:hypothetical protein